MNGNYEPMPLESPAQFLYWLENYLISVLKPGEAEPIMTQERAKIEAGGLPQDSPYWPNVVYHYLQFQQATQPEEPPTGITGGWETQVVADNTLAILRDDMGNITQTINLGATETGSITPYQQSHLDYLNQQFQWEQQQATQQQTWQQQQWAGEMALTQQQMAQQAGLQQGQWGMEAQLAMLPYQGMTVAEQSQADLARRQYLAEVMANPTRWIESYYAQQGEPVMPPWVTPTSAMPPIEIPQIQQPPLDMAAIMAMIEGLQQPTQWSPQTPWLPLSPEQQAMALQQQQAQFGAPARTLSPAETAQTQSVAGARYKAGYTGQSPTVAGAAAYTGKSYQQVESEMAAAKKRLAQPPTLAQAMAGRI